MKERDKTPGRWVTLRGGSKVYIKDGESLMDAMMRGGKKHDPVDKPKTKKQEFDDFVDSLGHHYYKKDIIAIYNKYVDMYGKKEIKLVNSFTDEVEKVFRDLNGLEEFIPDFNQEFMGMGLDKNNGLWISW